MTISAPRTGELPVAVAAFLAALGAGDLDAAADAVPAGALSALPADGVETGPRAIARDRVALRHALGVAFGDRRPEVLCAVGADDDGACLVEGHVRDASGAAVQTFLASFELEHRQLRRQ